MKRLLLLVAACAAILLATAAPAEARFFGVRCHANGNLQVDPIVSPGVFPSAHLHTFCLATGVTQNSTVATLEAGGTSAYAGLFSNATSSQVLMTPAQVAADTAGQWTPTMYVNGTAKNYAYIADYWSNTGISSTTFTNMPEGLQLIGGNPHATGPPPMDELYFDCENSTTPASPTPLDCGTHQLQVHVDFPVCWDGVGLTPADTAYPGAVTIPFKVAPKNKPCPAGFPVQLPRVQVIIHTGLHNFNGVVFSSGPWYTLHVDYWQTWADQARLAADEDFLRTGVIPAP